MPARKKDRRIVDRYKLPEGVKRTGRFSSGYSKGTRSIRQAEIYDISQESVSFRIDANYAPQIGELIAVEFRLPNSNQMAWYAQVVRTELEYIETKQDEFTQVLRIAATFVELPEFRKKQLGKLVEALATKIQDRDPPSRISILTEALIIRRRHDVTIWRFVRPVLIFMLSIFLAYELLSYLGRVGSRYSRGSGPPIWKDKAHTPFEEVGSPLAPKSE